MIRYRDLTRAEQKSLGIVAPRSKPKRVPVKASKPRLRRAKRKASRK